MENIFGELVKKLRTENMLSQQQLADMLFVNRCSIANWENGRRIPDIVVLARLSRALSVDPAVFANALDDSEDIPDVILVDDETIILQGTIPVLSEALPDANITGFSKPSEAVEFAKNTKIAVAFLDIEIGRTSGIELCKTLLEINPLTNVIFLTSYPDYALNAWDTGATGFLTKPLHLDDVNKQLSKLRHPVRGL